MEELVSVMSVMKIGGFKDWTVFDWRGSFMKGGFSICFKIKEIIIMVNLTRIDNYYLGCSGFK